MFDTEYVKAKEEDWNCHNCGTPRTECGKGDGCLHNGGIPTNWSDKKAIFTATQKQQIKFEHIQSLDDSEYFRRKRMILQKHRKGTDYEKSSKSL